MSYIGYKSQPLDFVTYKDGDPGGEGPQGRSIVSSTRYYALTDYVPKTPCITLSELETFKSNYFDNPDDDDHTRWSTVPPTYPDTDETNNTMMYYETTLTIYDDNSWHWSDPVKQTILDVDFIKSIGITTGWLTADDLSASKIEVKNSSSGQTIFKADGRAINSNGIDGPASDDDRVKIGGFTVTGNSLVGGSIAHPIRLGSTDYDIEYYSPSIGSILGSNNYPYKHLPWLASESCSFDAFSMMCTTLATADYASALVIKFNADHDTFSFYTGVFYSSDTVNSYIVVSRLITDENPLNYFPTDPEADRFNIKTTTYSSGLGEHDPSVNRNDLSSYKKVTFTDIKAGNYIYVTYVRGDKDFATGDVLIEDKAISLQAGTNFKVTSRGELTAVSGYIGGFEMYQEASNFVQGAVFKSYNPSQTNLFKYKNISNYYAVENIRLTLTDAGVDLAFKENRAEQYIPTIKLNDVDITDKYRIFTSNNTSKNTTAVCMKIKFTQDLPSFTCYIASSAESSYDYTIASILNATNIPQLYNHSEAKANTRGIQLKGSTSNKPILDLDSNYAVPVHYTDVKKDDYFYVVFRKDSSLAANLDVGWVIIPNTFDTHEFKSWERIGNIFMTPQGSKAALGENDITKNNWGLSIGKNFGVTLDGELFAKNADLSGKISVTEGTIGGFNIGLTNLSSKSITSSGYGLYLNEESVGVTTKNSSIVLGVENNGGSTTPYIQFDGVGEFRGPGGKCGFIFSGKSESATYEYMASVSINSDRDRVSVDVFKKYNKNWYPASTLGILSLITLYETFFKDTSAAGDFNNLYPDIKSFDKNNLPNFDLVRPVTFRVKVKGVDKGLFGIGNENITESKTITISPGEHSGSADLKKEFDVCDDFYFTESSETCTEVDTRNWTFKYTVKSSDAIESIGSIMPIANTGKVAKNCTLGGPDSQWHAVFAHDVHAASGHYYEDLAVNSEISTTSDKKLKNNIEYDISKYDKIFDTLKPVSYKYNDSKSGRTHLGFIAQDIQESIKSAGLTDKDYSIVTIEGDGFDANQGVVIDEENTIYRLRYSQLHALEVRQIQKLKKRVSDQEATIQTLETRIKALEEKNN